MHRGHSVFLQLCLTYVLQTKWQCHYRNREIQHLLELLVVSVGVSTISDGSLRSASRIWSEDLWTLQFEAMQVGQFIQMQPSSFNRQHRTCL
ncbi:hypothetical protein EDC04DRAFT_2636412 [Pisolithus marmoratus]|nr:hypothetical protein EDC04DRAFT_2636412 [Pisolithus marmoratus]